MKSTYPDRLLPLYIVNKTPQRYSREELRYSESKVKNYEINQ